MNTFAICRISLAIINFDLYAVNDTSIYFGTAAIQSVEVGGRYHAIERKKKNIKSNKIDAKKIINGNLECVKERL